MPTTGDYDPSALDRHGSSSASEGSSGRSDFLRDRDRILYSSAFRTLAGKTQVVATAELGNIHNRLTHSLKVAQLGRSVAVRLEGSGPNPDLVEAACLAHDIGHPPFGHAGEEALSYALYVLRCKEAGRQPAEREKDDAQVTDGFEGNAQNLRVLTFLSTHADSSGPGLHLTRGTLAAVTKYPWLRAAEGHRRRKWGAYSAESAVLDWVLEGRPDGAEEWPVEERLMDWCDDVTYACHDMEDFYRLGLIPLDRLFAFTVPAEHAYAGRDENAPLAEFLDFVDLDWDSEADGAFDRQEAVRELHRLSDRISVTEPFRPTRNHKGLLKQTITDLISHFVDEVTIEGDPPLSYSGQLVVPADRRLGCTLLKKLIWYYVIRKPAFAAQQRGQQRIVKDLVQWYAEDPNRLLPIDRREELQSHGDVGRAVADHVSTLPEDHAVALHRRLSGYEIGHVTDPV